MKLLRAPAHGFSKRLRHCTGRSARHGCQHLPVTIASDKVQWNFEVQQTLKRLTWHRAGKHIAPHHDLIYLRSTNVLKDSLKRRQVAMDIIDSRDPHNRPLSHPMHFAGGKSQRLQRNQALSTNSRRAQRPVPTEWCGYVFHFQWLTKTD